MFIVAVGALRFGSEVGCFIVFSGVMVIYGEVSLAVIPFVTMGGPQTNRDSKFICRDLWGTS